VRRKRARSQVATRLIELYDSFCMTEFMDQSAECDDLNVRVMRMLCYCFGRFGRSFTTERACDRDDMIRLEKLAVDGDGVAQANLGQCYLQGIGVEQDNTKARAWLEKSAAHGYLRGQAALGRFLLKNGPEAEHKRGLEWLKKAAACECPPAMCNLGLYLLDSAKTAKQFDEAKRWILKGADAGVTTGYAILCNSSFVDRDEVARLVRMAWERGTDIAGEIPPHLFSFGSVYGRDRLLGLRLARLPINRLKSVAKRDPVAKTYLAYLYLDGGLGLKSDDKKAVQLFREAAKRGVAAAQCLLGECYYNGRGCRKDVDSAFKWFSLAAQQGEFQALGWLGNLYYEGDGCKRDVRKSVSYHKRAAELGNEGAQYNLALRYLKQCDGLPYAPEKAVDILWVLACRGRPKAIARLGECYLTGEGVRKDVERAYGLLSVAAKFTDIGVLFENVIVRQLLGFLAFYDAARSRLDENDVEPSILRMLETYEQGKTREQ